MLQLPVVKDILFCLTAQNNFNIKVSTQAILKGPGIHKITNMSRKCLENIWKMTGICLENRDGRPAPPRGKTGCPAPPREKQALPRPAPQN